MYYIVLNTSGSILEFVTIAKDISNDLMLLDITTIPFIYEEKNGISYRIRLFDGIEDILDCLEKAFKTTNVKYCEINSIADIGSGDIKYSNMKAL